MADSRIAPPGLRHFRVVGVVTVEDPTLIVEAERLALWVEKSIPQGSTAQ